MSQDWCSAMPGGIRLVLYIAPNAKKNEVIGIHEDALKIRLHAPPVDGKANQALIRFIADVLDAPKTAVQIVHGHANRRKILELHGSSLTVEKVTQALAG